MRCVGLIVVLWALPLAEIHADDAWSTLPPDIRKDLVLYCAFDDKSASDRIEPITKGSVHGAKWTAEGRFGGGFTFSGGQWIDFGDLAKTDFGKSSFTVMFWVKGNEGTVVSKGYPHSKNPTDRGWQLIPNGIAVGHYANPSYQAVSYGFKKGRDDWHQVAGVVDADDGMVRMYRDGAPIRRKGMVKPLPDVDLSNNAHLVIGANWNVAAKDVRSTWFKGTLDELAIWNRALSAEEIRRVHEKQKQ